MKTLYLNTATKETTIALFEGSRVVGEERWPAENNESERLLPAVQKLLKDHEMEPENVGHLAVCVGPGGFTSVRIGISAANAWAKGMGVPVTAVSIFDLFATENMVIIAANAKEAWIQEPGKEPEFIHAESVELPKSFSFCGILNEDWMDLLKERGGVYEEVQEGLPDINILGFGNGIIQPWYYKAPNITWSNKNIKSKT